MFLKSRRTFLKSSFLSSCVLVFSGGEVFGAVSPIKTLELVQLDLFPNTKGVPSVKEVGAYKYIGLILHHSRVSDTQKKFIRDGVVWLNEEAIDIYKRSYTQLSEKERQNVLKSIAKYGWGESWIHTIFTYIFEAMFGDPIYAINKNQVGWKWLNFECGQPRPKEALL